MATAVDQLTDLCCPICLARFSEKKNVPHMLKCGHTHCNQCLSTIMSNGIGKCGECRNIILSTSVQSLPINYSILRLIESMKTNESKHNEFQAVEQKIDSMLKKLGETQDLYRTRIKELNKKINDLDVEKSQMKEAKQGLKKRSIDLGKSKTLDESLSIIKTTMDKIKEIEQQTLLISERLQKGHNLGCIQSLYDTPDEFYVSYRGMGAKCFSLNKKIYMKTFQPEPAQQSTVVINYHGLQPFMIGTFFIIEYNNYSSLLEFELFKEPNRGKHFVNLCMGHTGATYVGYKFCRHDRVKREGESVVVSRPHKDDPKAIPKDINKGVHKIDYIRKGYVEGLGSSPFSASHFRIYFEDWPCKKSQFCFGKLVRGASILKAALHNRYDVIVNESGLVFDPSLTA